MRSDTLLGTVSRGDAVERRVLGWVVIGGLAYYVPALALLHWLRPDVNPVARVTSEYAVGPFGALMVSTFFVLSLALAALGIGLARSLSLRIRSSPEILLLLLAGVAVAIAGIFPVDVGAVRPVTPAGWVHRIAATAAFPSITVAALLLSGRLRGVAAWRDLAWISFFVGSAGLLLFAAILLFFLERGLAGAAQRVLLILIVAWMVILGRRVIRQAVIG